MYRAYPAPNQSHQQQQQQRPNNGTTAANDGPPPPKFAPMVTRNGIPNNGNGIRNNGQPTSTGTGLNRGTRPSPAGLSNPMYTSTSTTTSRPMAPPSKKQKATGPQPPPSASSRTSDEITKLTSEGIAKRRAELRHLQSHRSTTADLLARARAVTSNTQGSGAGVRAGNGSSNVGGSSSSVGSTSASLAGRRNLGGVGGVGGGIQRKYGTTGVTSTSTTSTGGIGGYPSRTRPLIRLPKQTQPPQPQQQQQPQVPIQKLQTPNNVSPPANNNATVTATTETKKTSPNKKINVHAPSIPSSEFAKIKPMSSFDTSPTKNNVNGSSTSTAAKNTATATATNGTTTTTVAPPVMTEKLDDGNQVTPMKSNIAPPTTTSTTTTIPPPQGQQQQQPQQNVPEVVASPTSNTAASGPGPTNQQQQQQQPPSNKRETLKLLRDAAQSPSVPSMKEMNDKSNVTIPDQQQQQPPLIDESSTIVSAKEQQQQQLQQQDQSSYSKMMKELLNEKQLRAQALKQVAKLEKEVLDLRLQSTTNNSTTTNTATRGRQMEDRTRGRTGRSTSTRRRMKSPQPANRTRNDGTNSNNPLSDEDIACRAVETVEDVFSSDIATYVVRKPYGGNETMECVFPESSSTLSSGVNGSSGSHKETKKMGKIDCQLMWYESVENYLKLAKVQEEASIEIIARIDADDSVLLLHGSSCRHGIAILGNEGNITGFEWKSYDDIEKMDRSLGGIIYIDANGNEGEYWLDTIYEEALKIRENYCSNVFSAALALKASALDRAASTNGGASTGGGGFSPVTPMRQLEVPRQQQAQAHPQFQNQQQPPLQQFVPSAVPTKVVGVDACVGTSDDPAFFKPEKTAGAGASGVPPPKVESKKKKAVPKEQPPPVEMEDSGSTDVLSAFIIFFFGTIFSIIWFIISIPFRLMKWTFFASLICGLISLTWLYFADDNGAMSLGAGIDYQFNPTGVV